MTQAQRIYQEIRRKGFIFSYEITGDLGIQQYNARIYDLRKKFDCRCKHGKNDMCRAKEHIVSAADNKYVYIGDREVKPQLPPRNIVNTEAYKKFEEVGRLLKQGKTPPVKEETYEDMAYSVLTTKKMVAESWLKENEDHPRYQVALDRYQQICDALLMQDAERELL